MISMAVRILINQNNLKLSTCIIVASILFMDRLIQNSAIVSSDLLKPPQEKFNNKMSRCRKISDTGFFYLQDDMGYRVFPKNAPFGSRGYPKSMLAKMIQVFLIISSPNKARNKFGMRSLLYFFLNSAKVA